MHRPITGSSRLALSIIFLVVAFCEPSASNVHDHMLSEFFQVKDSTMRIKSFSSLARSSMKALEQIVSVLERQLDEYVCEGGKRCCSVSKPCLVSEGRCKHQWDCAADLFCGRANCQNAHNGRRYDCCHRLNPRPNFTLPITCTTELTGYASPENPCGLEKNQLP